MSATDRAPRSKTSVMLLALGAVILLFVLIFVKKFWPMISGKGFGGFQQRFIIGEVAKQSLPTFGAQSVPHDTIDTRSAND